MLDIMRPSHLDDLEMTDVKKAIESTKIEGVSAGISKTCELEGIVRRHERLFCRPCWVNAEGCSLAQEASNV